MVVYLVTQMMVVREISAKAARNKYTSWLVVILRDVMRRVTLTVRSEMARLLSSQVRNTLNLDGRGFRLKVITRLVVLVMTKSLMMPGVVGALRTGQDDGILHVPRKRIGRRVATLTVIHRMMTMGVGRK